MHLWHFSHTQLRGSIHTWLSLARRVSRDFKEYRTSGSIVNALQEIITSESLEHFSSSWGSSLTRLLLCNCTTSVNPWTYHWYALCSAWKTVRHAPMFTQQQLRHTDTGITYCLWSEQQWTRVPKILHQVIALPYSSKWMLENIALYRK